MESVELQKSTPTQITEVKMISIEIRRKIEVDDCLAEEIEELNNVYNITTLACCCGHGDEKEAFIAVDDNMYGLYEDIMEGSDVVISLLIMQKLGYNLAHEPYYYLAHDHEGKQKMKELPAFVPKSKCKCQKKD